MKIVIRVCVRIAYFYIYSVRTEPIQYAGRGQPYKQRAMPGVLFSQFRLRNKCCFQIFLSSFCWSEWEIDKEDAQGGSKSPPNYD